MNEPNLDQELERLLSAARAGTEPDANARSRIRAALAVGLTGAGAVKAGIAPRVGLGAKLWLLSAFAVAVLLGFSLLPRAEEPPPVPPAARVPTPASLVVVEPAVEPGPPPGDQSAAAAPTGAADAPRLASSLTRSVVKADEPADELALVSAMQLALRSGNASQALARANEHARRFPGGALAQEREGARAIARCQLAQPAARSAIQSVFEARYAGSPYAARVKDACAR